MNKNIILSFVATVSLLLGACDADFLDVKYDKRLEVASTAKDFQAMLDVTIIYNQYYPNLGELGTTDFYLLDARWNALPFIDRSAYIWQKEIFDPTETSRDWNESYKRIHNANAVIEGIESIEGNPSGTDAIKGAALFYRGYTMFELAQVFCTQWDERTASEELGLPVRLTSDINHRVQRSSLKETYDAILSDMLRAIPLLSERTPFSTQPSKAAGYGALSRIYLQMARYDLAYRYADSCLMYGAELLDYNRIDRVKNYPFARFNSEVIFHASLVPSTAFSQAALNIVQAQLDRYGPDDLRREAFFRTTASLTTFKGSYDGSALLFSGLSTGEILLIRAEAACRTERVDIALSDLDRLLSHRIRSAVYEAPQITDREVLLTYILEERRKELVFRGIRWKDLKRLNRYSERAVTLERKIGEETFRLEPNDKRYVLPIPYDALIKGGLVQNER